MVSLLKRQSNNLKKDHLILALCGLTGIAVNQTFFFIGLNLTRPVDTALLHSGSPVIVLLFSVWLAVEKVLGAVGAVLLVIHGNFSSKGGNHLLGNTLIFMNIFSYSLSLILINPLMLKYSAVTIMKWVFL